MINNTIIINKYYAVFDDRYEYVAIINEHTKERYDNSPNVFYMCEVEGDEISLINNKIDNGFFVVYNTETKDYEFVFKEYECAVWNGYELTVDYAEAVEELERAIMSQSRDLDLLISNINKCNIVLESTDETVNELFIFGMMMTRDEIGSQILIMKQDYATGLQKMNELKKKIHSLPPEEITKSKLRLLDGLSISYLRSDYEFGDLTEEQVKTMYSAMIENMKEIPFATKFVSANYIRYSAAFLGDSKFSANKNRNNYMKNNTDSALAKDIIDNGTYWPIAALELDDLTYSLLEGNYRVGSIKDAIRYNVIDDYQFFTITNKIKTTGYKTITLKIPYSPDLAYMKHHPYYRSLYRTPNLKISDDGLFYIATYTKAYIDNLGVQFAIDALNVYGIGLNNYVFKYKLKPCDLPGSDYINNKAVGLPYGFDTGDVFVTDTMNENYLKEDDIMGVIR
ncbi:MAG: hypothetical protein ACRDD8_05390 [Bacteroidales bacterium]